MLSDSRPANEPAGNSAASYSSGPCHVELAGSNSFKAKSVSPAQHARSSDVESFAAPAACQRGNPICTARKMYKSKIVMDLSVLSERYS